MLKNTDILIESQIPEAIRQDVPRFVAFLEAYYNFLNSYSLDVLSLRDVDLTADNLVAFLKREFANKFPQAVVNDRKLITIINDLYKKKGTIDALKLLFRLFFNEAIIVEQPNKYLLRASDGKWLQDNSILLKDRFGDFDANDEIILKIENIYGIFFLEIDRIERNEADQESRFFYKGFRTVPLEPNQYVDIVDLNGLITYRGQLIQGPSSIRILKPGKYWKLGQIFYFPSLDDVGEPSIVMVTGVDSNGAVTDTRVIQFGSKHNSYQLVSTSPYPNKPAGTTYDLSEDLQIDGSLLYTLDITDFIDDYKEVAEATSDIWSENTYFERHFIETSPGVYVEDLSADYMVRGYVGNPEFYQVEETSFSPSNSVQDPSLTLEQYLESKATFAFNFDYEVAYPGKYATIEGQLSNPYVRLQDSYYYQLFSYVILSTINYNDFAGVLNMIHPAGLKFFGELQKTAILSFGEEIEGVNVFSRGSVYLNDQTNTSDYFEALITYIRSISDSVSVSEAFFSTATLNKTLDTETVGASDAGQSFETVAYVATGQDYFAEQYTSISLQQTIGT